MIQREISPRYISSGGLLPHFSFPFSLSYTFNRLHNQIPFILFVFSQVIFYRQSNPKLLKMDDPWYGGRPGEIEELIRGNAEYLQQTNPGAFGQGGIGKPYGSRDLSRERSSRPSSRHEREPSWMGSPGRVLGEIHEDEEWPEEAYPGEFAELGLAAAPLRGRPSASPGLHSRSSSQRPSPYSSTDRQRGRSTAPQPRSRAPSNQPSYRTIAPKPQPSNQQTTQGRRIHATRDERAFYKQSSPPEQKSLEYGSSSHEKKGRSPATAGLTSPAARRQRKFDRDHRPCIRGVVERSTTLKPEGLYKMEGKGPGYDEPRFDKSIDDVVSGNKQTIRKNGQRVYVSVEDLAQFEKSQHNFYKATLNRRNRLEKKYEPESLRKLLEEDLRHKGGRPPRGLRASLKRKNLSRTMDQLM